MKRVKYWLYAARPKTLTAALIPVATATALCYGEGGGRWQPALLCMLFAALMQVAANLINDLYDYLKGTDRADRLGPERACAQGWITPRAMKRGIVIVLILACAAGCCLIPYGGWPLVGIGVACVVFAFLYTTLLSYMGCGDLLVWVFFGLVPVCGTCYVQMGEIPAAAWWLAAGCGLVTDTLLVLNNYRDYEQDALSGKRTLIVAFGKQFGSLFYLGQGILGWLCLAMTFCYGYGWAPVITVPYLLTHTLAWYRMTRLTGRRLNQILGMTSANMLLLAVLTVIAFLIK